MVAVENRNSKTLTEIIKKHVKPGSIVHTDLWKGYSDIEGETGQTHRTVNDSKCFKDPFTGVHTNYVEGTNFGLKRLVPIRNRTRDGIEEHLSEFIWRKANHNDFWKAFIDAIRAIQYDLY